MKKISFINFLDLAALCLLAKTAEIIINIGITEDNPFSDFPIEKLGLAEGVIVTFVLVLSLVIIIARIYEDNKTVHSSVCITYSGKLYNLIDELRNCGIYHHWDIDNCYMFRTTRLIFPDLRVTLTKEDESWCLRCNDSALKQIQKYSTGDLLATCKDLENISYTKNYN